MISYTDIYDCPVDAFHRCVETGELKYLLKEGTYDKSMDKELWGVFEKINDQKIDQFGTSSEFQTYFFKQRDINKLELKLLKGDIGVQTVLNTYKSDLERIKKTLKEDGDIRKQHARLHRIIQTTYVGRDTHKLTVFEFYNDLEDIRNQQRPSSDLTATAFKKHG